MNFTIIEHTPSTAEYDRCSGSYYGYSCSDLEINYYDDYEDALAAADRTASDDNEVTILIDGINIEYILENSVDSDLREKATALKSLL